MRVIAPYTKRVDEVLDALGAACEDFEPYYVGRRDRDYFDLLSMLWADGETVCVVEHDVVVGLDTLDDLASCAHDWCGFPYRYGNTITHGLGCVKFGADLIARNPDAMRRVGVMFDGEHEKRHWCRLDAWLQGCVLTDAGEVKHEHLPPVTHLGVGCSHGCTPNF